MVQKLIGRLRRFGREAWIHSQSPQAKIANALTNLILQWIFRRHH